MKLKLLTLLLFVGTFSMFSQSKKELEAKEFFWGTNDTYHDKTEIPDKWKNESAVVIYKNVNYDFHKYGKNVTYANSVRKRIKLLDKASVEEFSEFSYRKRFRAAKGQALWTKKNKGNNFVGVKVVKPDGTEIEIDVENDAVEVDGETKIAIANLEVGDIIDYYAYQLEEFKTTYQYGFEPVETVLGEDYPIMDFRLFLETENDFFINFNTYNGAPELEEIPTDKRNMRRYELIASNVEKNDFPRWFYPLVVMPAYKFQVYFARSGRFEDNAMAFLPEKENIIKKAVSKQEVLDLYEARFSASGDIGDVKDFSKGKTFNSDSEKVMEAYYFMRHYYLTRFLEAFYVKEADILAYPFEVYGNNPVFIQTEKEFVRHFIEYLNREKIGYEIVISKRRFDGGIDDLLIERNLEPFLKVNTSPPVYLEFFGPHTTANYIQPLLEGTDAYLLSPTKRKLDVIKEGQLPLSTYKENETKKDMTFTLNENLDGFELTSVNSFKGQEKVDMQYDRLLFSDYVNEDYKRYETESYTELIRNKKTRAKVENELKSLIAKLQTKQKERFENSAKNEYGAEEIEDYAYSIDETGRYGTDSYMSFTESFKAKNALIKKAGPNYIIEIGKLIGGQIDLEKKERTRDVGVYMDHPRSYNYRIEFNIPSGYTVSGLDKLTKNVDNKAGAFISTAEVEGDKLVITTSKQYKSNYEPKENWPLMIAFLDEANQFTNEKILLKKE